MGYVIFATIYEFPSLVIMGYVIFAMTNDWVFYNLPTSIFYAQKSVCLK
jgi:hypothetical protein